MATVLLGAYTQKECGLPSYKPCSHAASQPDSEHTGQGAATCACSCPSCRTLLKSCYPRIGLKTVCLQILARSCVWEPQSGRPHAEVVWS